MNDTVVVKETETEIISIGTQGPAGPPGVQGPVGPAGADGVDMLSGIFTPQFNYVSVSYNSQLGKYRKIGDMIWCEIELDYTGLDTADTSVIQIGGLPENVKSNGHLIGQFDTSNSTGLILQANDVILLSSINLTTQIIFTDGTGNSYRYHNGKLAAAGTLRFSLMYLCA